MKKIILSVLLGMSCVCFAEHCVDDHSIEIVNPNNSRNVYTWHRHQDGNYHWTRFYVNRNGTLMKLESRLSRRLPF